MKSDYLDFFILLEKTLADFYKALQKESEFDRIRSVLEFMETHSEAHAEKIAEIKKKFIKPEIDDRLILDVQNNITQYLKKSIKNERDLLKILKTLADSEESIGVMYEKFSRYLKELSGYYTGMAGEIDGIAAEEYNHRDILLKDRDSLMKKTR